MTRPVEPVPGDLALRDLALDVAGAAARLAREMRDRGIDVAATKSSAVDVVTEADRAVEAQLRRQLLAARPHDTIMGEEGDDHPGTSDVRWIIDPIDGTVNYLYGQSEWAVSVAAERDGDVVAAAVVNGSTGSAYAAARGHGARLDGAPLHVRAPAPVAERLVLTGFGYRADVRAHQASCVARLLPRVRDIRRVGSAALDLCHVAEGTADAYVEEGPQPWDYAAGGLVVAEAGGRFDVLPGRLHQSVPTAPRMSLVTAAPAEAWDSWLGVLRGTGFLAE